eukprot:gnl/TRDRNA2_/TRDRNA2_184262_c0_seq1.p1 gnl/TRDRNA2_/TRDRNA2_184262_c0~~gnl/TRDRNA2_/TRDRNA2_184262_c0_seq1.p1  ORF type:complete len:526 (+),score=157.03 gnl/TRDRNA2_/TRDRNA2_184262_c0_seq1:83-1579(+)
MDGKQAVSLAKSVLVVAKKIGEADLEDGKGPAPELAKSADKQVSQNRGEGALTAALDALAYLSQTICDEVLTNIRTQTIGSMKEGITATQAAAKAYKRAGDKEGEALALLALSGCQLLAAQSQPGAKSAKSSLAIYRSAANQRGEARALLMYANSFIVAASNGEKEVMNNPAYALTSKADVLVAAREDRIQKAADLSDQAAEIYRVLQETKLEAWAVKKAGDAQMIKGSPDRAKASTAEAICLFQELQDADGEAACIITNISCELDLQDGDAAMSSAMDLIQLRRNSRNKKGEAEARHFLAKVHCARGEHAECQEAGMEALDIFRAISERRGGGLAVWHTLMQPALQKPDYAAAFATGKDGISWLQQQGDRKGEADLTHAVAQVYIEKIFKELDDQMKEDPSDMTMPDAALDEAFKMMQRALDIFKAEGDGPNEEAVIQTIKATVDRCTEFNNKMFNTEDVEQICHITDSNEFMKIENKKASWDELMAKQASMPAIGN